MFPNLPKLLLPITTACVFCLALGCQTNRSLVTSFAPDSANSPTLGDSFLRISEPTECDDTCDESTTALESISPNAMIDYKNISYTPITLEECIRRALADSEVFRKLGGTIVSQPGSIDTALDPAIAYSDPRLGEQAALSAFDASVAASLFFENNDRPFNNQFSGDSNGLLLQDLGEYQLEFSKLAATGTLFTARQTINYENNNQAGNRFQGSVWETIIDAGFRHPLMQGSGTLFNRIAGPSQIPGQYNGVLIARTNTEISLSEFQQATRELVANVENAYWDLYYTYKELDAQIDARDAAKLVYENRLEQSKAERVSNLETASAKEQYLRFESSIIESLEGRNIDGTQANNGSTGGSFRRTVGVRVAERRLRYLIGMPITDGTLLQPNDAPFPAAIVFDWDQSVQTAISLRPETRRQRWVVKQKELELTASRNFLQPRLDLVGNYRFRGLGKDLVGGGTTFGGDIANGTSLSSAFSDLAGGDYQEVQLGAEFRMPVGYRQANAAVRNAELGVQRARKVLEEQERKIVLDLSNAVAETRRAFAALEVARKRFEAAVEYRSQAAIRVKDNRTQMDVLLEAQRRILESQLQFINAEVEYTQAIKNVHFEKGSYLRYHGVQLQESESDAKAYQDAAARYSKRSAELNYVVRDAAIGRKLEDAVEMNAVPMSVDGLPAETLPGVPVENGTTMPMGTSIPQGDAAVIGSEAKSPLVSPQVPGTTDLQSPFVPVPGSQPDGILPTSPLNPTPLNPSAPVEGFSPQGSSHQRFKFGDDGATSQVGPASFLDAAAGDANQQLASPTGPQVATLSDSTRQSSESSATGSNLSSAPATIGFSDQQTPTIKVSDQPGSSTSSLKLTDGAAAKLNSSPVKATFGGPLDARADTSVAQASLRDQSEPLARSIDSAGDSIANSKSSQPEVSSRQTSRRRQR